MGSSPPRGRPGQWRVAGTTQLVGLGYGFLFRDAKGEMEVAQGESWGGSEWNLKGSLRLPRKESHAPGATPWLPRLPGHTTCLCPRSTRAAGHWHSLRAAGGSQARSALSAKPGGWALAAGCAVTFPVEDVGTEACAQATWRRAGGLSSRAASFPLGPAKSWQARSPFVTPGASNHSASISLTLFIPLKTHLKTLQPGVCSGLYPH